VYDALRTRRPYRDAWESERALGYIESKAGTEFDPDVAQAFTTMMRQFDRRLVVVDESTPVQVGGPENAVVTAGTPNEPSR
jgi:putative two-component system response regulator